MAKEKRVKKRIVGITGGIGAGKSAVATLYREAGYPVFSADEIAREIVDVGSSALGEIAQVFGPQSLRADGSLDRAYVRQAMASHPDLRLKLEAITHPRIQARSESLAREAFAKGATIVFYEAPLLFEAKSDRAMDKVICVHAPDEMRIERTMKRDGCSREEAEKILRSQMLQEEKMRRADFLIENAGDLAQLKAAAMLVLVALARK